MATGIRGGLAGYREGEKRGRATLQGHREEEHEYKYMERDRESSRWQNIDMMRYMRRERVTVCSMLYTGQPSRDSIPEARIPGSVEEHARYCTNHHW
jgi:hypothetical protein